MGKKKPSSRFRSISEFVSKEPKEQCQEWWVGHGWEARKCQCPPESQDICGSRTRRFHQKKHHTLYLVIFSATSIMLPAMGRSGSSCLQSNCMNQHHYGLSRIPHRFVILPKFTMPSLSIGAETYRRYSVGCLAFHDIIRNRRL